MACWCTCTRSLWPPSLSKATWDEVFCFACYLGAHLAFELLYTSVGVFLMGTAQRWATQQVGGGEGRGFTDGSHVGAGWLVCGARLLFCCGIVATPHKLAHVHV